MEQNEIDPYRFSKEVIEYFNMVRSNPKKFASIIREYKQYFKGKVLRVPNSKVGIMTKEGADAFEEAAKYLDSVKAINTVKYNVGLTHVAKEVVDAAAKTDDINSLDELDMDAIFEKYGKFVGAFSRAMDFGSKDSKMVIINLIVCDGDSSRGQREGIFNSDGTLQAYKEKALSRSYIQAYQGYPLSFNFNDETKEAKAQFQFKKEITEPSILYINSKLNYPNGYYLTVTNEEGENIDANVKEIDENYISIYVNDEEDGIKVNIKLVPK